MLSDSSGGSGLGDTGSCDSLVPEILSSGTGSLGRVEVTLSGGLSGSSASQGRVGRCGLGLSIEVCLDSISSGCSKGSRCRDVSTVGCLVGCPSVGVEERCGERIVDVVDRGTWYGGCPTIKVLAFDSGPIVRSNSGSPYDKCTFMLPFEADLL